MERFYRELNKLDGMIAQGLPDMERIAERLLQGPLADALTHIGQLSMLRRLAGDAVSGESFFRAEITVKD